MTRALFLDKDNNVLVIPDNDESHRQFLIRQGIVDSKDDDGDDDDESVINKAFKKGYVRARNVGTLKKDAPTIIIDHLRNELLEPNVIFKILKNLSVVYKHDIYEQNVERPKSFSGTYKDYHEYYDKQRKFKNTAKTITNMRDYL